ncbi:MAG TPA: EAL domain-containing protein [Actinomycetales bacterium]|nr:EAL domain-containing protein [Actinomycetales bacterium]
MPNVRPPEAVRGKSVTKVPFTLLAVLVVVTVILIWLQLLARFTGRWTGADVHLAWLLTAASVVLLLATVVMHRARSRAIAASELTGWRLGAFMSASNEVAWETTADGVITFAGPHLKEILGYEPCEVIGSNSADLLGPGQFQRLQQLRAQAVTTTKGWTDQPLVYVSKAGELTRLSTSALLRQDRDGAPVGFTGILRRTDIPRLEETERQAITRRVQDVLVHGGLEIALQPIIDTATGTLIGAEALSRFPRHPHITPDRWFDEAAHVGLGADLELLAITAALTSAARLPVSAYLSINTSPATLATGRIRHVIEQSDWPARQVIVEITEHASVDHYEDLRPAISDLRSRGVRLAVDDAGSGYASFRHILELQPDYIKLDRQIVEGIDRDPAKRALVVALVAFAREVDASIVAEGIENNDELSTIAKLGVHAAQGYHIGVPALTGALA